MTTEPGALAAIAPDLIDISTLFGPWPIASADMTAASLLQLMARHGVKRACTLSTLAVLLDAAIGNTATGAACKEHSELVPATSLDPTHLTANAAAVRSLKQQGFRLLRFYPNIQGWPVTSVAFAGLAREAAAQGLPIAVQVDRPGMVSDLARTVGGTGDVILVGIDLRLATEAVAALADKPTWSIETSQLHATGLIAALAEQLGADRLVFGTGAPAQPVAAAATALLRAALPPGDTQKIAAGNARRILKLDA
ncbi:MAG: amidohydrolase family protein [Armatimonadetes bacterium]|nr:amidohydrolase family protein [Armatimonadota bacterium]MDE2207273.1 amidohydrolase family protein [Armatimonadota bacterium]